jgi:hypothetical protein
MVDRRVYLPSAPIINYLSRNALGVPAPTLKDQTGIST